MSEALQNHGAWLRNTHVSASEAVDDFKYQERTQSPIYLAFDPSIIFAPLALRNKPLEIENPDDWLDIAADIVFWNLDNVDPNRFGYKLVMPHTTYLTVLYNYKIDLDLIEAIEGARDIDDMFHKLNARLSGNSPYGSAAAKTIEDFLKRADKKHRRLERLLSYIVTRKIMLEDAVFDKEGIKRTRITKDEFDRLYAEINKFRSDTGPNTGTPREMFTKTIEVMGLIDTKKKTEELSNGRYLFLAWPKSRSYYKAASNYHRVIITPMMRILAMRSDVGVNLIDLKENSNYLLRKVRESIAEKTQISDLIYQNIVTLYETIVGFMDDEMKKIAKHDSAPVTGNRDLGDLSMRGMLNAARLAKARVRKTLEELSDEFEQYNSIAGWEELPDDHPIKIVVANAKPAP